MISLEAYLFHALWGTLHKGETSLDIECEKEYYNEVIDFCLLFNGLLKCKIQENGSFCCYWDKIDIEKIQREVTRLWSQFRRTPAHQHEVKVRDGRLFRKILENRCEGDEQEVLARIVTRGARKKNEEINILWQYPLIWKYEWETKRQDGTVEGKGDLVLSDFDKNYLVVEVKHLNWEATGKERRNDRRKQKKEGRKQAEKYLSLFADKNPQSNSIEAGLCYNGKDGRLYFEEVTGQIKSVKDKGEESESESESESERDARKRKEDIGEDEDMRKFLGIAALLIGGVATAGAGWYAMQKEEERRQKEEEERRRKEEAFEPIFFALLIFVAYYVWSWVYT